LFQLGGVDRLGIIRSVVAVRTTVTTPMSDKSDVLIMKFLEGG
jgi:hypothetical protein